VAPTLATDNYDGNTILGTSAGMPTKTRNVTALALGSLGSKHWTLSLMTLRAIFITHLHGDHC
jgi:ribonuclease Z